TRGRLVAGVAIGHHTRQLESAIHRPSTSRSMPTVRRIAPANPSRKPASKASCPLYVRSSLIAPPESFGVLPKGTYATPAPLQSRHDSCFVNPAALTFRASGLTFHADAPVLQQLTQGGLQGRPPSAPPHPLACAFLASVGTL